MTFNADAKRNIMKLIAAFRSVVKTPLNTNVSTVSNHNVNFLILSHFYTQLPHLQSNAQQYMFDCKNYIKADW